MTPNREASLTAVADRLNVRKAAAHLGLSASTLNKMRVDGRGPRYRRRSTAENSASPPRAH